MAESRLNRTRQLYHNTETSLSDPETYRQFLYSASQNFGLPVDQQILVFAQRPDATAVLPMTSWNSRFNRYVISGRKSIFVLQDTADERTEVIKLFDYSDTTEGRDQSRTKQEYVRWEAEQADYVGMMAGLINTYGEIEQSFNLIDDIRSLVQIAVEDELPDYIRPEQVDNMQEIRTLVYHSVSCMVLDRLGFSEYYSANDFESISKYGVQIVGNAVSDIAGGFLREIREEITAIHRERSTQTERISNEIRPSRDNNNISQRETNDHAIDGRATVRAGLDSGHSGDRSSGDESSGDQRTGIDITRTGTGGRGIIQPGNIRESATPLHEGVQETIVSGTPEERGTESVLEDSGGERAGGGRVSGQESLQTGGSDRGAQSEGSNDLGRPDEQHQGERQTRDHERDDLRLNETQIAESVNAFSAFSLPENVIRTVLQMGSNREHSQERILFEFMLDRTQQEHSDFLKEEYRSGGKGIITEDDTRYAVWWNEDGMQIVSGDSVVQDTIDKASMSWMQVTELVGQMIQEGTYASKETIENVIPYVTHEYAFYLAYMHGDMEEGVPESVFGEYDSLFVPGYPDTVRNIENFLQDPDHVQNLIYRLEGMNNAYQINPGIMRWNTYNPERMIGIFQRYAMTRHTLPVSDAFVQYPTRGFITDDEINNWFAEKNVFSNTHFTIYAFFQSHSDRKERAEFLKHHYGDGGSSHALSGADDSWVDYSAAGIRFRRYEEGCETRITWPQSVARINTLIEKDAYLSEKEKEQLPAYERNYLASRLMWLYSDVPSGIERPYQGNPFSDGNEILKDLQNQLSNTTSLQMLVEKIGNDILNLPDTVRSKSEWKELSFILSAYAEGSYSIYKPFSMPDDLFSDDPAISNQIEDPDDNIYTYHFETGNQLYLDEGTYIIDDVVGDTIVMHDVNFPLFQEQRNMQDIIDIVSQDGRNNHLLHPADRADESVNESEPEIQTNDIMNHHFYMNGEDGQMTWIYHLEDLDRPCYVHNVISYDDVYRAIAVTSSYDELFALLEAEHQPDILYAGDDGYEAIAIYEDATEPDYAGLSKETLDGIFYDVTAYRNRLSERISDEHPVTGDEISEPEEEDRSSTSDAAVSPADILGSIDAAEIIDNRGKGGALWIVGSFDDLSGTMEQFEQIGVHFVFKKNGAKATKGRDAWWTKADVDLQINDIQSVQRDTVVESTEETESIHTGEYIDDDVIPVPQYKRDQSQMVPSLLYPDIPADDRLHFDLTENPIEEVGPAARFERNLQAIRILKTLQQEERFASSDEQIILSKYVGWGGLADYFKEDHSGYQELKDLLSDDEYTAARQSTLTAFYTPPEIISGIWDALKNMGFSSGNILEPSCGVGNFLGCINAKTYQNSQIYGVELDTISGSIAQQLYQDAAITIQGYEKTNLPDSFFDVAIGNVPFGQFGVADRKYDRYHFLIHDYFFAKTLDKLRPGGVMAFITSKGTMDKESENVRRYLAERAELLGAIRLPNNTFKGNAGTEVTSDILFLQKRDARTLSEPDWVHLGTDDNGFVMNQYFIDHPEMVLGTMQMVSGRFGPELQCIADEGTVLSERLHEAILCIQGEITASEHIRKNDDVVVIPADPTVRNFSFTVIDNKIYFRDNAQMIQKEYPVTSVNRIKGMIGVRDAVRDVIELQTNNAGDAQVIAAQKKLGAVYDSFTARYGLINSRANQRVFAEDSSLPLLTSLELLDEDGNLEKKADIFTKRTIRPDIRVEEVDTSIEALAVCLNDRGYIDIPYMANLLTGPDDETTKAHRIIDELTGVIYKIPDSGAYHSSDGIDDISRGWVTAEEYLSGNVRLKLKEALDAAEKDNYFLSNVSALEKAQPRDLNATEIDVRLGATWVPESDIDRFIWDTLETPRYMQSRSQWFNRRICCHYSPVSGEWQIEGKSFDSMNIKAISTYGTERINAYHIIEQTLNLKDVRVNDSYIDPSGKRVTVLNKRETQLAQEKQEQLKQAFKDWIWNDPDRRNRLVKLYNERFNSTVPRSYDGSHLVFHGMNPEIKMRPHQMNAIARILYGGNTLLGHKVGAGKTFTMASAAMEMKRLGMCSKSMFVVPNHLTVQWASEFLRLYPAANLLVATKKDFETQNRKRFCSRIATGDYDAIIIGHSQFEKIPLSLEFQRRSLDRQIQDIVDAINSAGISERNSFSVKQMEKTLHALNVRLEKLNDQSKKDDVVTFEELGVDRIFVDESHYFKNLYIYTKMRNIGGIAQTEAKKSNDLYMKTQYLDELTGNKGVIFATGTPISNSMVEMFTIQRYLQGDVLREHGIQSFDAWASTFGETITAIELAPDGTGFRAKTRFSRFFNLPELTNMFREVADIQTEDMLNLDVPKANFHNIAVKPSEIQKSLVEELSARAEAVHQNRVDSRVDNMLLITNDGRKLALDQRLIDPMLPDFEGSKVNACVENVFQIWKDTTERSGTQLIFCDLSTPRSDGEFSVYNDVRQKLIDKGIPMDEIKFIHEADTEAKKQELFKKVDRGAVRILMGSTAKMGAGTNVQKKLCALHDLDCPWRPSDLEQRSGRIIRQGNENKEVAIYRYVTEETFDAYLYQLVENKQRFASQIMTSKAAVRSADDIDETALSYAEIKMLATGNPHIKEKMDLEMQVQRLQVLKSGYLSEKYRLEDMIAYKYPKDISESKQRIDGLKKDLIIVSEHPRQNDDDSFVGMQVGDNVITERKEAGEAIIKACSSWKGTEAITFGSYRGFTMKLSYNLVDRCFQMDLFASRHHIVNLGKDAGGNITRMDNALDGIEKTLLQNESALKQMEQQFRTAQEEVTKPFMQEDELTAKLNRLAELNAMLDLDKQDQIVMDDERDQSQSSGDRTQESDFERDDDERCIG